MALAGRAAYDGALSSPHPDSAMATPSLQAPHAVRAAHIKQVAEAAGATLRQRHPILRHQDAIGAGILAFSLLGMLASGWLYVQGTWPAWLTIVFTAMFASLTHELEHDLIHKMYFRKTPWAHNLMMGLVWLARPSTINPWVRRELHFHHHKTSGQPIDLEERAITNGEPWGLRRLLMLADNALAVLLRAHHAPSPLNIVKRSFLAYFPLGVVFWASWHAFLAFHALDAIANVVGAPIAWSVGTQSFMHTLDTWVVVLIAPNVLRSFSLHFVSSNMHYHGDVEAGNQIEECQVLDSWLMLPFHLFCFNFGSTHAIHHFLVKEPFYVRQLTAAVVKPVMREMGVRFNDFGTFGRANRLGRSRLAGPARDNPQASTQGSVA